jgi:transposase
LPPHLPREEIIHDLPSEGKSCGHCGSFLSKIGIEEREQLETVSVQFIVKKHKRLKYACRCCGQTVAIAKSPDQAIEKGIAGPNLLAQVLVDKYGDHLPLYRQEQRFKRHNIHMSRSTLWNWIYLSSLSLAPLVDAMKKDLLVVGHVFADETTMPTLRSQIPDNLGKKTKTNYMWVYNGPSKADKKFPIAIYDFTEGRDGKYPEGFLKGFSGYVQVDAYSGYNGLFAKLNPNEAVCIELGCWAHVRRYFYEALQANPNSIAKEVLAMIGELYKVERKCREESLKTEEIQKKRQEHSKLALNRIYDWLVKHQPQVLPKSLLGQAISYALNHWKALNVYVEDGRLEIDNNRSERCIKGIVLGRKNYLFMGGVKGGKAAAVIYSLIETCKQNDVDPVAYLADVLARVPTHPNKRIQELLPYHWKPPQYQDIGEHPKRGGIEEKQGLQECLRIAIFCFLGYS